MSKKHDFGGMTIDASEPIRTSWGRPAFPSHGSMGEVVQEGMTLRDYFAAKAMQGFAACDAEWPTAEAVAVNAYEWADAMLKARQ